jgi:hypothetical protein
MKEKSDSFIIQCRTNYFLGIRPANKQSKETEGYKALVKIAKTYFESNRYDEFAGGFMEGQYFIPLWTAHLILEYGQPNKHIRELCLKAILDYSDNPIAPDVAIEERAWLESYYDSH